MIILKFTLNLKGNKRTQKRLIALIILIYLGDLKNLGCIELSHRKAQFPHT
jgi:hypothetical protein